MPVVFDANILSLLLHQTARIPCPPGSTTPTSNAKERIELLLAELTKAKETILIPAPALAEFLCVVEEAGPGYLQVVGRNSGFEIAPFDAKAAIEAADIMRRFAKESGHKKGLGEGDWQKVKVDQQIVAIAKAQGAECLYTSDRGVANMARAMNVKAVALWELPVPPSQTPLSDVLEQTSTVTSSDAGSGAAQRSAQPLVGDLHIETPSEPPSTLSEQPQPDSSTPAAPPSHSKE